MPTPVDKYVEQVKKDNPNYSAEQVWATAWSIYCKYKNPGSEHCQRPPEEYFMREAKTIFRVASLARYADISVGETFESDTWRIHRDYRGSLTVTHLENAGKRGKKVQVFALYDKIRNTPIEGVIAELEMLAARNAPLARMEKALEEAVEVSGGGLEVESRTERGVDVMPAGFKVISIDGDKVYVEAEYDTFRVKDKEDPANERTCIPSISGGKKSIPIFYRWVRDNESKIRKMTFREVLKAMKDNGISYHYYCAMD